MISMGLRPCCLNFYKVESASHDAIDCCISSRSPVYVEYLRSMYVECGLIEYHKQNYSTK